MFPEKKNKNDESTPEYLFLTNLRARVDIKQNIEV
jgi:hypothetical protein